MNTQKYRKIINEKLIQKDLLRNRRKKKNTKLLEEKNKYQLFLKTQEIIQEVARQTQNEIKIHISDIVNLAIDSIPFEEKPDYFDLEFIIRRNQTECDLFYVKNENKMNPLQSSGGGLLDITSFGLRIACWSLQVEEKSNTILIDEPFKNINDPKKKLNLMEHICEMVKKVSDRLNIQFIIVGMNDDFMEIADRVFMAINSNKEKIKRIK